jgi:AmmeMemoRadiSam system protein A
MEFSARHCALMLDVARVAIRRALAGDEPVFPDVRELASRAALATALQAHVLSQSAGDMLGTAAAAAVDEAESSAAPPSDLGWDPLADATLHQPAGCFVTLHTLHGRRLRGCVGRLDAAKPLLEAVFATSLSALEDPRFRYSPVYLEELPELELEISVISPLRPVEHPLAFELQSEGIYLTIGQRSGCFLPQVARETGWTREQLLERLCTEKMGLPCSAWQNAEAQLSVFSTVMVGPEPFVPAGSMIDRA